MSSYHIWPTHIHLPRIFVIGKSSSLAMTRVNCRKQDRSIHINEICSHKVGTAINISRLQRVEKDAYGNEPRTSRNSS